VRAVPGVFNISSHETELARQDTLVSALGAGLRFRVCHGYPDAPERSSRCNASLQGIVGQFPCPLLS
jgi:hypothetical protein